MVGISAALTAMVRSEVDTPSSTRWSASRTSRPVRELKADAERGAQRARQARPEAQAARSIPIDRAMELVVEDLRQHPEHATEPPPPDAGKKTDADAGAAADPDAADAGADGQPKRPQLRKAHRRKASPRRHRSADRRGLAASRAPAPEDQGTAPSQPETGNGKKSQGARQLAEPASRQPRPRRPRRTDPRVRTSFRAPSTVLRSGLAALTLAADSRWRRRSANGSCRAASFDPRRPLDRRSGGVGVGQARRPERAQGAHRAAAEAARGHRRRRAPERRAAEDVEFKDEHGRG